MVAGVSGNELQDFVRRLAAPHDAQAQGGSFLGRQLHGDEVTEIFPGIIPVSIQDNEAFGGLLVQLPQHLRTAGGVDDDVQVRQFEQLGAIGGDQKIVAPGVQDAGSFRVQVGHAQHPQGIIILAGGHQGLQDGHPLPAGADNAEIIFEFRGIHATTPKTSRTANQPRPWGEPR